MPTVCRGCGCTITVTVTGTIKGCNSTGLVGVAVVVKDHGSGSTLATFTTTTGGAIPGGSTFSASSGQQIDFVVTLTPRFLTSTTAVTISGSTVALGNITLPVNTTSYVCVSGCALPLNKTLTWTNSGSCGGVGTGCATFTNCTLTYGANPVGQSATDWWANVSNTICGVAGCGPGGSGGNLTLSYMWFQATNVLGVYEPAPSCGATTSVQIGTLPTVTCPTVGGGIFTAVYTCTFNQAKGTISE